MAFNPQVENALNLPIQYLLGKAVFRNAVSDHTAQLGHGFEYGHVVAHPAKEEGTTESGGSATDDSDSFAGGRCCGNGKSLA